MKYIEVYANDLNWHVAFAYYLRPHSLLFIYLFFLDIKLFIIYYYYLLFYYYILLFITISSFRRIERWQLLYESNRDGNLL
jgi:hypothetical protein